MPGSVAEDVIRVARGGVGRGVEVLEHCADEGHGGAGGDGGVPEPLADRPVVLRDRRFGRGPGGLLGGGPGLTREELADGLFEAGERGGTGTDGDGVEPVELGDGLRFGVEGDVGLLPEVVLAVGMDMPARAGGVGADGDGGEAVVGVKVDGQTACGDVIVDALGLGAHRADLLAAAPGHGVVAPGPFGVDLLLEGAVDLGGESVAPQLLGGEVGVVGLC
ncbi:hypothetical protein [Streptomyces sp. NRRL F-5193]|uniref:hypothetical protein n=1 Tax=Streptomyces sp. NRRL F-5193 TaxID=1463860 RepID=UPI000D14671F|nr:hypothetical protein [Streptomyces sp. NRRL F-5193]